MFASTKEELENEIKIQHTARIMPQDQNSGGFYIALIKKHKATKFAALESKLEAKIEDEGKIEDEQNELSEEEQIVNTETGEVFLRNPTSEPKGELLGIKREEPKDLDLISPDFGNTDQIPNLSSYKLLNEKDQAKYEKVPEEVWTRIKNIFGISEEFPAHLLTVPNIQGKKVYILSESIASVLQNDVKKSLNCVYFGTTLFVRNKNQIAEEDEYRLSHAGLKYIYPFMNKKIFHISRKEFNYLVKKGQTIYHEELKANLEESFERFLDLKIGSYCLVYKGEDLETEELLTITKMTNSIVVMVPKEDIAGLRIKFDL